MKRPFRKKKIDSIEEFMGIVYENQSLFKQIEITDITHKKAALKYPSKTESTEKENDHKKEIVKSLYLSTYRLELFSLSIPLKRHKLKLAGEKLKLQLRKNEGMAFSIEAEKFNRNTVSLLLHHHNGDDIREVMMYAEEYAHSFLELKPSLWERITAFFKKKFAQ